MAEDYATKSDLGILKTELLERIEAVRVETLERIEKVETTLLSEFRKWAVPTTARLRSLETLNERVLLIEERLDELEKR